MEVWHSLIYGIIQGLTEFLPVSSSGHLALLPRFLKIEDPGVAFDLFMHVGTALAVICYFRTEVLHLLKKVLTLPSKYRDPYATNYFIASIVTVVFVLVLKDMAADWGRSVLFIAINLFIFGLFLFLSDRQSEETSLSFNKLDKNTIKSAALVGLLQALAIFPGVSRSGSTIGMARFLGYSRQEASSFSFVLSLPIIFGGMVFKFPELINSQGSLNLQVCLIGLLSSFFVGLMTIHFFLKLIQKVGLGVFFIYRTILAILLIVLFYL